MTLAARLPISAIHACEKQLNMACVRTAVSVPEAVYESECRSQRLY